MPDSQRQTIARLIPDLTKPLESDFLEAVLKLYGPANAAEVSQDVRTALLACGPLGRSAMQAIVGRNLLFRQGLTVAQRDRMMAAASPVGASAPVALNDAPWSEVVPGIAFMRLKLNTGNLVRGTLDLRIVPPWEAQAGSGGETRELPSLMSLFGARFASDGQVRVTGLVGYSVAGNIATCDLLSCNRELKTGTFDWLI